jgi:hypothetical protein
VARNSVRKTNPINLTRYFFQLLQNVDANVSSRCLQVSFCVVICRYRNGAGNGWPSKRVFTRKLMFVLCDTVTWQLCTTRPIGGLLHLLYAIQTLERLYFVAQLDFLRCTIARHKIIDRVNLPRRESNDNFEMKRFSIEKTLGCNAVR